MELFEYSTDLNREFWREMKRFYPRLIQINFSIFFSKIIFYGLIFHLKDIGSIENYLGNCEIIDFKIKVRDLKLFVYPPEDSDSSPTF